MGRGIDVIYFTLTDPTWDLGYLPGMLSEKDPRPAKEQLHTGYSHGGGWAPFSGFRFNAKNFTLTYPGDPPMRLAARAQLRDETILVFEGDWVLILQKDGAWEVARMN